MGPGIGATSPSTLHPRPRGGWEGHTFSTETVPEQLWHLTEPTPALLPVHLRPGRRGSDFTALRSLAQGSHEQTAHGPRAGYVEEPAPSVLQAGPVQQGGSTDTTPRTQRGEDLEVWQAQAKPLHCHHRFTAKQRGRLDTGSPGHRSGDPHQATGMGLLRISENPRSQWFDKEVYFSAV